MHLSVLRAPQINDRNATLRANLPDSPRKEQVEHLATQALLGAPALSMFRQRLEKLHACADRALDRAETSVRVVKDERGRLVAVGADLSPIAPLLNQAHKNLEMLGRATGELELVGGPSLSIQIICPSAPADAMPRVTFMSDDAIDAEGEEQIGLLQR
jgi:hypothetical protein